MKVLKSLSTSVFLCIITLMVLHNMMPHTHQNSCASKGIKHLPSNHTHQLHTSAWGALKSPAHSLIHQHEQVHCELCPELLTTLETKNSTHQNLLIGAYPTGSNLMFFLGEPSQTNDSGHRPLNYSLQDPFLRFSSWKAPPFGC